MGGVMEFGLKVSNLPSDFLLEYIGSKRCAMVYEM